MKFNIFAKYLKYFSLAIILAIFGLTVFFLYNNFYETITQAKTVYVLKNQVALEVADVHLYDQIKINLTDKKSLGSFELRDLNNPFAPHL